MRRLIAFLLFLCFCCVSNTYAHVPSSAKHRVIQLFKNAQQVRQHKEPNDKNLSVATDGSEDVSFNSFQDDDDDEEDCLLKKRASFVRDITDAITTFFLIQQQADATAKVLLFSPYLPCYQSGKYLTLRTLRI